MELNLYYEFSSHKIPISDSTKEQKKDGRPNKWICGQSSQRIIWRANKYTSLSTGVECSPTESLKKLRACTFLIKFAAGQLTRRTRAKAAVVATWWTW